MTAGLPVPWPLLTKRLKEGRTIPFLGAGASAYRDCAPVSDPDHREIDPSDNIGYPPTGAELLSMLADDVGLSDIVRCGRGTCTRTVLDLARVASYYQLVGGTRTDLDKFLRARLSPAFRPTGLHLLLAQIARKVPMLIVTTNYDGLIEAAFDHPLDEAENGSVPYEVVATAADHLAELDGNISGQHQPAGSLYHRIGGRQSCGFSSRNPADLEFDLTERSVIYKIHGSMPCGNEWDGGFLIAEEDYARFLGRMDRPEVVPPAILRLMGEREWVDEGSGKSKMLKRSFLFLGYGLQDWNLRVLLDGLGIGLRAPNAERHYAFQRSPDPVDSALLTKRNIEVFEVDLSEVVKKLKEKLM